jgi:hypothetical protein
MRVPHKRETASIYFYERTTEIVLKQQVSLQRKMIIEKLDTKGWKGLQRSQIIPIMLTAGLTACCRKEL